MRAKAEKRARKGKLQAGIPAATRRELIRRFRAADSTRTFGLRLRRMGRGRVSLEMRAERRFLQAHGRLHGGVIALLADTAAALAIYSALPARSCVLTLEMKINFLAGVERGAIAAHGKALRVGRNTGVSECEVRDAGGRLAAKALVTFTISPPPGSFTRRGSRMRGA